MTDWPHAPTHRLQERGAYMVTAGCYRKELLFLGSSRLDYLQDQLVSLANRYAWRLQAWAVFANHYHFIAQAPEDPGSLKTLVRHLHSTTAREVNLLDNASGRKVWFEYWDTHLTFERSYHARLNYVHQNPVRHGWGDATSYPWCSAGWFERTAAPAFRRTVRSFKTDDLRVPDDFGWTGGANE